MAPKKTSRGKDKVTEVLVENEDFNEDDDSNSGEDEDGSESLLAWELPLVSSLHSDYEGNGDNTGYESEKLDRYPISEDEDDDSWDQNVEFNEKAEYGDVVLQLGMGFPSLQVFKEALKDFSIHLGRQFNFIKNDKVRCRAKCTVDTCPWEIYCAWNGKTGCFQIKSYKDEHTCSREFWIKNANRKWVAKQLVPELMHLTWSDAFDFLKEKRGVHVGESQVFRAMKLARTIVEGTEKDQYKLLADYCEELKNRNEGSTVELSVKFNNPDNPGAPGVFDRLYICLEACKRGFKNGCRPLIGLDGCFLKGYYGGEFLTAVGQDGNNAYFVIAYAFVDSETKDTWMWFLTKLLEDLGDYREHGWNFVSDQQKVIHFTLHLTVLLYILHYILLFLKLLLWCTKLR